MGRAAWNKVTIDDSDDDDDIDDENPVSNSDHGLGTLITTWSGDGQTAIEN